MYALNSKMVSNICSDGKKSLRKIGRFIINILLLTSTLKLSVKVNRDVNKTQNTSKNVLICSKIVSLPEKLRYVWVSTRDVVFRKYNLPCNNQHRYGVNLQINRKITHASILLLLAGHIARNPGPGKHTNRENQYVKCLALNARSLMSLHRSNIGNDLIDSNMESPQNLIYSEDPDIVCVNETWLTQDIKNTEILHSGYDIHRNDRGSRGGGVLLAIKISSFKSVREIHHGHDLEISMAEITTKSNENLLICSCYRPPSSDHSWLDKFNNFLADVCLRHTSIVIAGDFNMPHISWDSPEKTSGVNENTFAELLHDHFLEQLNTAPTRGKYTLDLLLTNIPNKVKISEILSPAQAELYTDHNIIVFELSVRHNHLPKIHRTVYNYRQGDFAGLRNSLECVNLESLITTDENINHNWQQWKGAFLEAVSQHIPSMRVKGRNYVPWMNSTMLHNIKKKNSLSLRINKSSSPTEYLVEKFRTLRSSIKRMLRDSRSIYLNSICSSRALNPKRFWSLFKFKNKTRNIPEKLSVKVTETKRSFADNPADIATLFNTYFTSIFTTDPKVEVCGPDALPNQSNNTIIEDIALSEADVFSILYNLDNNKAQGPDGIPARLLKETARQITPSLTLLFNKSLSTGVLPRDWKLANVVPVHKKDNKEHVENYRPISLLSLISKALERCVFNKI